MEEYNLLVKEITPEEVKSLDPYEITYIAMKDGSILMVIEKNAIIKNNYELKKTVKKNVVKEQTSPSFNLEGKKKYTSFISKKSEIEQSPNDEEEDFNVFYSNSNSKKTYKEYELKNIKSIKEENIVNDNSFYSYDDINPSCKMKNGIKPCNIINIEYNYQNGPIDEKQAQNDLDKLKMNNTTVYNTDDNFEKNKSPYYVIKKKYKFYKKSNVANQSNEKKPINKRATLYPSQHINKNNIYYSKSSENLCDNNNIEIKYSKYSVDNNKDKYSGNSYRNEFGHKEYPRNYNYLSQKISKDENILNEEQKLNRTFVSNNNNKNNFNYYETYKKNKENNKRVDNINNIDYYENKNYRNISRLSSVCDDLKLENINKNIRSRTPLYTTKDLKKNHTNHHKQSKNNNTELKKWLSKENHKYYERREVSASKKDNSKYIKMKDFNGKTVHIFENK